MADADHHHDITALYEDTPDYRGDDILHLNQSLIVITTVIIMARAFARGVLTKALGTDDILAFLSWVSEHQHMSQERGGGRVEADGISS
jgi:hypothetical protein